MTDHHNRGHGRGASLVGTLVATGILVVALLLVLQGYYHASDALRRTNNRALAMMVLETQAETLRAAGHSALPSVGRHAMPDDMLTGLPGAIGTVTVQPGPVEGMHTVSLELEWPTDGETPVRADMVFALSRDGLDP